MFIDEMLIQENQDVINFFNADAMFDEMDKFLEKYGRGRIFEREFDTKENCILNYCIRSHVVKLAMDACEHYSKAILIKNGSHWDDMKSVGHNLFKAYNLFSDEDKKAINNAMGFNSDPKGEGILDYIDSLSTIYIDEGLKTKKLDNASFEEILLSLSTERVLPNIKSRYPGQAVVDYDEKFVVAYACILHELCYKYKNKREFFDNEDNITK